MNMITELLLKRLHPFQQRKLYKTCNKCLCVLVFYTKMPYYRENNILQSRIVSILGYLAPEQNFMMDVQQAITILKILIYPDWGSNFQPFSQISNVWTARSGHW